MRETIEAIKRFNESTKEYFTIIKTFFYYLTHPKALLLWLWNMAVDYSFYVCLSIFLISLVLYIIGIKKARVYAQLSFFIFLVIKIFDRVM